MARIAGVDLPRNKRSYIALTYIYGIGTSRANRILDAAKVDPMKKIQDLGEDEVNRIRTVIEEEGLQKEGTQTRSIRDRAHPGFVQQHDRDHHRSERERVVLEEFRLARFSRVA